ncbi:hypothetical protein AYI70_g12457 [Smittium culicis]|uniref:Uncharacterized protein n=1 Tax=Smittium culicis TaxID=133412 RepID=A0A1R1WXF1_9FUNG|nr:hypothetical protein AYI70_g12457 [Smittium culicis]
MKIFASSVLVATLFSSTLGLETSVAPRQLNLNALGAINIGQNSTLASAIPATAAAGVANVGFTSLVASKPPQASSTVQFQTILVSTIPATSKLDAVDSVINDINNIISPSPTVSSRGGNIGDATVTSIAGSSDNSGGVGGGGVAAAAGGAAAVAAAAAAAAAGGAPVTVTRTDSNGNQVVEQVVPVQQPSSTAASPAPVPSPPTVSIVSSSAQSDAASTFSLNTSFSSLVFALSLSALLI